MPDVQEIFLGSHVAHVRELKTQVAALKAENAALRDENAALRSHFDLALLAAEDLRSLPEDGRLVIVDGWNLILGADKEARDPKDLIARAERHLAGRPQDAVWIVFDGPKENVTVRGRLRISYTGGTGAHRADRFICDFLRMARFRGDLDRIEVKTHDRDFIKEMKRLRT